MSNEQYDPERAERHRRRGEEAAKLLHNELQEDRRQHLLDMGASKELADQGSQSPDAFRTVQSQLSQTS